MGRFVENIDDFPLIHEYWDSPNKIKRCIIDIRNIWHNFDDIFSQVSKLHCPKIEIRSYCILTLLEIKEIVEKFEKFDFGVLLLLLPYDENLFTESSSAELAKLINQDYRIILNVYNVANDIQIELDKIKDHFPPLSYNMSTSAKRVLCKDDCGTINYENFHEMSIEDIMENKLYSGCLNRVISIDEDGVIKNCPSMCVEYGNIKTTSLLDVYESEDFRKIWNISNSMIDGCRECELRIICLGCRAYITDPNNLYSKPAKCNYIP